MLALLITLVTSQSCTLLPKTTLCGPDFEGYPITKPLPEFILNLKLKVQNTTSTAQDLVNANVCTSKVFETIKDLRFQVSLNCGREVQNAISQGCKPVKPEGMYMCERECLLAVSSLKKLAGNKEVCSGDISTVSAEGYCKYSQEGVEKGGVCFKGVPDDVFLGGKLDRSITITNYHKL
jgi:hypothetical protein